MWSFFWTWRVAVLGLISSQPVSMCGHRWKPSQLINKTATDEAAGLKAEFSHQTTHLYQALRGLLQALYWNDQFNYFSDYDWPTWGVVKWTPITCFFRPGPITCITNIFRKDPAVRIDSGVWHGLDSTPHHNVWYFHLMICEIYSQGNLWGILASFCCPSFLLPPVVLSQLEGRPWFGVCNVCNHDGTLI